MEVDAIANPSQQSGLSVHPTQNKEYTPPPSGPKSQPSTNPQHVFKTHIPGERKVKRNSRKKLRARMQPETNLTKDYSLERFKNSVSKSEKATIAGKSKSTK